MQDMRAGEIQRVRRMNDEKLVQRFSEALRKVKADDELISELYQILGAVQYALLDR